MTIARVKPSNWAPGENLTYLQINAVDTNVTNALDKTAAGDTLAGPVVVTGSIQFSGPTNNPLMSSRTITRIMTGGVTPGPNWAANPEWVPNATAQANQEGIYFELKIPHGAVLNSVTCRFDGGGGHVALPATKTSLQVKSINAAGAVVTSGSAVDGSANVAAYDAPHDLTLTGLSTTIDRTTLRYFASVFPEHGTNSVPGFPPIIFIKATWTQTTYEED